MIIVLKRNATKEKIEELKGQLMQQGVAVNTWVGQHETCLLYTSWGGPRRKRILCAFSVP